MYLLGLDIGSTGCKALVFDTNGNIHGSGFEEYGIILDHTGKAEQDAENIWDITCRVISKAVKDIKKTRDSRFKPFSTG